MLDTNIYSEVTPDIIQLAALSEKAGVIETELFKKYDVKRGLRDENGKGVLTGLTNISIVKSFGLFNIISFISSLLNSLANITLFAPLLYQNLQVW